MASFTKYVWSLLLGNAAGNASPIHAALIHFPATLYPIAFGSDLIGLALDRFPVTTLVQGLGARGLYALSYYATAAALVTTIPAALTGLAEYFAINKTRSPEAKSYAFWHGALNFATGGIALFNFLTKRKTIDYAPYNFNVFLSGVGFVIVFSSLYLGGHMVYKYGVGVRRMGTGVEPTPNPNSDLKTELNVPEILPKVSEKAKKI
ncbi:hypothetical protein PhCBS80983_g05789 [Powellomyces hirtus]|uniref:DUF2231 domain-containing protein n=1 Tax=Powellomyces hirtus TaxID=109895 RepID=A0A507DU36_9FUNG|nr:hypothetical protein PhCBS80983_g05789 [Powellomyces hirtus]